MRWLPLLLVLAACSSPPRERFYTLDAPEPPAAAQGAPSIAVGPVTVPDLVDRPQIVVRGGPNQVHIVEQARWAEPLRSAIARVVAANLAAELGMRLAGPARNADADYRVALQFLEQHVPANNSPMCGNSICQDRRFLARWMPRLEAHFHYRNLDVSTLKELVRRWKPELMKGFAKEGRHEALADILESIEELKFYRKAVMTI